MTNIELVKESYQAGATGDLEHFRELLSPEINWTEMAGFPYGGTYIGIEEVISGIFARIAGDWEDFRVQPDIYHDAGDIIVASGFYSGTYKKTGRNFKARFTHIWKIENGRLAAMEQFIDTLLVDRAIHPS